MRCCGPFKLLTGFDNGVNIVTPTVEPGAPDVPLVADITANSMTLSWTAPSDDGGSPVISYTIEKREKYGKWLKANRQPVTDTTITLQDLAEGMEYEFRVCAENKAGPGKFSEATVPKIAKNPYGKCFCVFFFSDSN